MTESVWLWSKTAATNATADGAINWAEGQSPGSVNNSARSMMAGLAKSRDDTGGQLTTAGGTTAYTLATNQGLGTLADGVRVHAVVNASNTAASTLNVDSLGAKSIRKVTFGSTNDVDIVAGDMRANHHAVFEYDASANAAAGAWILLNPLAVVSFSAHKNGSDQTGLTSGTLTQITFGTEYFDIGGFYASNAWTPPAGKAMITASVTFTATNATDGGIHALFLYKDGAAFQAGMRVSNGAASILALQGAWIVDCSGSAVFTIYASGVGSGDRTVDGTASSTVFSGTMLR